MHTHFDFPWVAELLEFQDLIVLFIVGNVEDVLRDIVSKLVDHGNVLDGVHFLVALVRSHRRVVQHLLNLAVFIYDGYRWLPRVLNDLDHLVICCLLRILLLDRRDLLDINCSILWNDLLRMQTVFLDDLSKRSRIDHDDLIRIDDLHDHFVLH